MLIGRTLIRIALVNRYHMSKQFCDTPLPPTDTYLFTALDLYGLFFIPLNCLKSCIIIPGHFFPLHSFSSEGLFVQLPKHFWGCFSMQVLSCLGQTKYLTTISKFLKKPEKQRSCQGKFLNRLLIRGET